LRRCVVVKFLTDFVVENREVRVGHAITLALELKEQVLTLKIFDYRMHEYVYNVHDQILQWMTDAVQEHHHFETIRTEIVCLKGKLHVDKDFMTCMSAAFRVCLYLSKLDSVFESKEDFNEDSWSLQGNICRMLEWVQSNHGVQNDECTPLVSPAMTQTVYEICPKNCYIVLAPYVPQAGVAQHPLSAYHDIATVADKISQHYHYSLARHTLVCSSGSGV
jgi:hypothetical protein